jgi:hypothetical protein
MAVDHRGSWANRRSAPEFGRHLREEPPIGELFRQLSDDATRLIRQEVALGKVELKQTGRALAKDATKIGIALGMGLMGAMAALAFLIIGLGALLGNYWLSALIIAVVLLGIGGFLARNAAEDVRSRDLKPTETIRTLQADAEWAKREAAAVKREWKS